MVLVRARIERKRRVYPGVILLSWSDFDAETKRGSCIPHHFVANVHIPAKSRNVLSTTRITTYSKIPNASIHNLPIPIPIPTLTTTDPTVPQAHPSIPIAIPHTSQITHLNIPPTPHTLPNKHLSAAPLLFPSYVSIILRTCETLPLLTRHTNVQRNVGKLACAGSRVARGGLDGRRS